MEYVMHAKTDVAGHDVQNAAGWRGLLAIKQVRGVETGR